MKAALEALKPNIQHVPAAVGNANKGYLVLENIPFTVTVDENGWTCKIEVTFGTAVTEQTDAHAATTIGKGTYVAHLVTTEHANGDIKTEAQDGKIVESGDYKYQLVNRPTFSDERNYWGCVGFIIYGKDESLKSGEIDFTTIKLTNEDGKPILTIGGTHENCTAEDFTFDVESTKKFPITPTVTFDGNKFTAKIDLSTLAPAAQYYMHFVIAATGNGNVANTDTDYDAVVSTITIGTKTYSIVKTNISWGPCVWCLKIEDPEAPKLTFTSAKLVQEDGDKVYLEMKATAERYTEELVQKITFAGSDSGLTVDLPANGTLAESEVTLRIEVSQIAAKGSDYYGKWWRMYLECDGNPLDRINCPSIETKTLQNIGGHNYELGNDGGLPYVVVTAA